VKNGEGGGPTTFWGGRRGKVQIITSSAVKKEGMLSSKVEMTPGRKKDMIRGLVSKIDILIGSDS